MWQLNRMEVFKEVVERKSFSAAARHKRVTPSLISQTIRQLESELGVKLLNRTTRKIWLTEAGRLFYEASANAVLEAERAISRIRQLAEVPSGPLKVTAESEFGARFLVPAVSDFLKSYPQVSLDLILTDQVLDLSENDIDLALRGGISRNARETGIKLAEIPHLVCGSPAYLNKEGYPKTPSELTRHSWINHRIFGKTRRLIFEAPGGKELAVEVRGSICVNTIQCIVGFALQSAGLIMMPEFYVDHHLKSGSLVRLLEDWKLPPVPIYAVTKTSEEPLSKANAFVQFLRESDLLEPWRPGHRD